MNSVKFFIKFIDIKIMKQNRTFFLLTVSFIFLSPFLFSSDFSNGRLPDFAEAKEAEHKGDSGDALLAYAQMGEHAKSLSTREAARLAEAFLMYKCGDYQGAVKRYSRLIRRSQGTPAGDLALLFTAYALNRLNRDQDVLAYTGEIISNGYEHPLYFDAVRLNARTLLKTGETERAIRSFEELLKSPLLNPDGVFTVSGGKLTAEKRRAQVHYELFKIFLKIYDAEKASESARVVRDFSPDSREGLNARLFLANRMGDAGDFVRMIEELDDIASSRVGTPAVFEAAFILSMIYEERDEREKSYKILKKLADENVSANEYAGYARYKLANEAYEAGDIVSAVNDLKVFLNGLKTAPERESALVLLYKITEKAENTTLVFDPEEKKYKFTGNQALKYEVLKRLVSDYLNIENMDRFLIEILPLAKEAGEARFESAAYKKLVLIRPDDPRTKAAFDKLSDDAKRML